MTIRMSAREARSRFAELLGMVHYGDQVVVIGRSGRPMVAVIPVEMYERLIAERESRFQVVERIRGRLPEMPSDRVERDVSEAIRAARGSGASGRP